MDETLREFDRRERKRTGVLCVLWSIVLTVIALTVAIVIWAWLDEWAFIAIITIFALCGMLALTGVYQTLANAPDAWSILRWSIAYLTILGLLGIAIYATLNRTVLSPDYVPLEPGAYIAGFLSTRAGHPAASHTSVGTSPPVVPTATRQPTPGPTYAAIPTPIATPEPTPQPTYSPYPSPTSADMPTPEPVATPEPTPVPTATVPPVTPTPIPLSVDIVSVSFVGVGYTLYLQIPRIPGGDTHEQIRLVVSDQNGMVKEDSQGFVQAGNGDYVGAVVIDREQLPNPDLEWVKANLTIHAIPQRGAGMVDAVPNPTVTKTRGTVVPTMTPRPTIAPSPTVAPPAQKPDSPLQERFNRDDLETNILRMVNDYRVAEGKSALRVDARLTQIARSHSQDMAQSNHYSHTNLRGEGPTARARRVGYDCHNPMSIGIAENIHVLHGHTSTLRTTSGTVYYWTTQEALARRFADDWIASPGHRRNILDSRYGLTGVGVAFGSYNGIEHAIFVTHNFC